jgi:hypothetical protein
VWWELVHHPTNSFQSLMNDGLSSKIYESWPLEWILIVPFFSCSRKWWYFRAITLYQVAFLELLLIHRPTCCLHIEFQNVSLNPAHIHMPSSKLKAGLCSNVRLELDYGIWSLHGNTTNSEIDAIRLFTVWCTPATSKASINKALDTFGTI